MLSAVAPAPSLAWRRALPALLLVELALLVAYFDTAAAMVEIWRRSETFNHAFLVLPVTLWLVWEKRAALAPLSPQPAPWLAVPLALVGSGWLLGELAAANVVAQFALVAMLILAVPLTLGLALARRIAFPLCFLFFAVPFGEFALPRLMAWTADFTVLGLRLTGIPVFQEGLHFVIPSGRWSVIEACSGVRYLIASAMLGTLFAYLSYRSLRRRLIFVGVSLLVPLVANWVRAYLTVLLGHASNNALAVGVDHLLYGWAFFGLVIGILFVIGLRWREDVDAPPAAPTVAAGATSSPSRLVLAAALGMALALAPAIALRALEASAPASAPPVLAAERLETGGWQRSAAAPVVWEPAFVNPSATLNLGLQRDERRIGVHIAYYRQQDKTRKLIGSSNELVRSDDPIWAPVERGAIVLPGRDGTHTVPTAALRNSRSSEGAAALRIKVWHWYWIDGRIVAGAAHGKLLLALARLRGQGDDAAAVFVFAVEPGADEVLADYLATAGDGIAALLKAAVQPAPTSITAARAQN